MATGYVSCSSGMNWGVKTTVRQVEEIEIEPEFFQDV
jgi:hypothetical protein